MANRTEITVHLHGDAEFLSELRTLVELEGYTVTEHIEEADVILCRRLPVLRAGEGAHRYVAVGDEADYEEIRQILRGYETARGEGVQRDAVIDRQRRTVFFCGASARLTEREFALFIALKEAEGEALSRKELHRRVWGGEGREQNVDVYVCYLREKLEAAFGPGHLRAVRGVGYRLVGL